MQPTMEEERGIKENSGDSFFSKSSNFREEKKKKVLIPGW